MGQAHYHHHQQQHGHCRQHCVTWTPEAVPGGDECWRVPHEGSCLWRCTITACMFGSVCQSSTQMKACTETTPPPVAPWHDYNQEQQTCSFSPVAQPDNSRRSEMPLECALESPAVTIGDTAGEGARMTKTARCCKWQTVSNLDIKS